MVLGQQLAEAQNLELEVRPLAVVDGDAADLELAKLASLSTTIGFEDIVEAAQDIVEGRIRGRVVVDM